MLGNKTIFLMLAVTYTACGIQNSTPNGTTIEFDDLLKPHYQSALHNLNCDNVRDITIPIFDGQGQTLSFSYISCVDDTEGQIVDFSHKSGFFISENYVLGKYKILTPASFFEVSPDASKYIYLDIPILGVAKLEGLSPEDYLKSKNPFNKFDWNICQIKKWDENIWGLENPSFKEVPAETYTISNYSSFSEWKLNHEADKVKYREKFGDQKLRNRACRNEQHNWYVAQDGILITIPNSENYSGGVNPTTIVYEDSR